MQLNFKKYGTQGPPLVVLHGLFGSSENWMSIAKTLSEDYQIYALDLRNHGQSPWSEAWDYEVMGQDISEFVASQNLKNFYLLGHSLGGKVAMHYACQYGKIEGLEKLIVVDISTRAYPVQHNYILEALKSIDLAALKGRKEADEALKNAIPEMGVRQFLLKNLQRQEDNAFAWQINLKVIDEKIENVGKALPQGFKFEKPTLFIKGADSNYIKSDELDTFKQYFPAATLSTIAKAGHWVHAERPADFTEVLTEFLSS